MMSGRSVRKELEQYLREFNLATIRQTYADVARQAEQEGLGYEEYLLELVEQKCEVRLVTDRAVFTGVPVAVGKEHGELRYEAAAEEGGIFSEGTFRGLAFGNPGSGKTHLLCAVGQELVRQGHRIYFTPCSLLVQELLRAKRELKLDHLLKKLSRYEAVILDDIGEEMEVLFTLLAYRYERGSVMLTSNLPFSKWESIFKDPMTTAAAIDRLVYHSVILELNVASYRMEQAKKTDCLKLMRERLLSCLRPCFCSALGSGTKRGLSFRREIVEAAASKSEVSRYGLR